VRVITPGGPGALSIDSFLRKADRRKLAAALNTLSRTATFHLPSICRDSVFYDVPLIAT